MAPPTPMYVCVDMIVYSLADNSILMIRRGNEPFKGRCALPGGYVDPGETIEEAAYRELYEETGVRLLRGGPTSLQFFRQYSDPKRDPRGRVISLVFFTQVKRKPVLRAGDDAAGVEWRPVPRILSDDLSFDHEKIIKDFLAALHHQERMRQGELYRRRA